MLLLFLLRSSTPIRLFQQQRLFSIAIVVPLKRFAQIIYQLLFIIVGHLIMQLILFDFKLLQLLLHLSPLSFLSHSPLPHRQIVQEDLLDAQRFQNVQHDVHVRLIVDLQQLHLIAGQLTLSGRVDDHLLRGGR
jgi:hypothetical protein